MGKGGFSQDTGEVTRGGLALLLGHEQVRPRQPSGAPHSVLLDPQGGLLVLFMGKETKTWQGWVSGPKQYNSVDI